MTVLQIALPSKGALQVPTIDLLRRCLLGVRGGGADRSYVGELEGMAGVSVVFARADEITQLVQAARVHVGITGLDLFREAHEAEDDRRARSVLDDLGFGSAQLVVGVPATWIDVDTMGDLLDVAHDVRQKRGRPLLVATKFPNLTRKHFLHVGLADFRIVQSLGATEAAPQTGSADVIVDLVSTGRTFASNGLKTIHDGLVLNSQACLIASGNASRWTDAARDSFRHLGELLGAGLRARSVRTVRALFDEAIDAVPRPVAPYLKDARILHSSVGPHELRGTVSLDSIHQLLFETRRAGAKSVEISEPNIILEHESPRVEAFLDSLGTRVRPRSPGEPRTQSLRRVVRTVGE